MACPAEPILASTLYSVLSDNLADGRHYKRRKIGTGCAAIDDALGGGLTYGDGGVCCMSGEAGTGMQEISYHLLTSHLLSHDSATATVMDALGTFDVVKLHKCIASRISSSPGEKEVGSAASAARALDRVKIMRVFDFEGMLEGIEEMRLDLQRARMSQLKVPANELEKIPKTTIADSQDEGADEMLDSGQPLGVPAESGHADDQKETAIDDEMEGSSMLIVDNMTQLVGPVMKSNHVQGQALLTSFIRSLRHTAREYELCAVLLNSAVTYKDVQETCSIFSSITSRPALGKTLTYLIDTHLFVNRLPRTAKDAAQHGRDPGVSGGKGQTRWVNVVEVLQDRHTDRVGQFGVFIVDTQGLLKEAF